MSRRKQAKPRAFLKIGDGPDGSGSVVAADSGDPLELLHPKQELCSDNDDVDASDDGNVFGDDDDTNTPEPAEETDGHKAAHAMPKQQKPQLREEPTLQQQQQQQPQQSKPKQRQLCALVDNNAVDSANVSGEPVAAAKHAAKDVAVKAGPRKDMRRPASALGLRVVHEKTDSEDDHLLDDELVDDYDDFDDEYDDEDLHSLDSFYSDMYSTHTSSSYSPSISDGTITPNSLHHLPPSHPHHQHHVQLQGHLQDDDSESSGVPMTQRLHKYGVSNTNGNGPGCDAGGKVLESAPNVEGGGKSSRLERRIHSKNAAAVEQLKRRHSLKMPNKLRKIDRGGVLGEAHKFDKTTGDGIKHTSNADGSYQCQFCDKSFPRLGYLKKHEQSHAEHLPFKCDYCARLFKHKRSRDRHTKLHTGDRRYRCPHCEAAFSRSDHLKIHMKTHDNQKPFQCTICNRGYNTAAALTSHMQNHKKQAAILAAGGNPQALNYSPRSTGSASSNGSLHKRRYAMAIIASDSSPSSRLEYAKRQRSALITCNYCTKADFTSVDQLSAHIQSMHEKELPPPQSSVQAPNQAEGATSQSKGFQLSCEYCTMTFPNIPAMFQHMRNAHVDRLSSPNSYFEHFNRLAASGTFSPRLVTTSYGKPSLRRGAEANPIKLEQKSLSPKHNEATHEEEPTDLSQNKRRSATPITQHCSPPSHQGGGEKPGVFFCNQCNAGLPDFDSFRNHLKSHIAQGANLVCHHCGLGLREQTDYERHIISHFLITSAEYNCAASNCNKTYAKPEELQKHLMEQHAVTVFKCSLCAELFESKVAVQVHFACTHSAETKLFRCSACLEIFRAEAEFNLHVKTHHQQGVHNGGGGANALQCMFCRTVCSSELEMHFHLAAHARQFRCPSCPETFHVEFLLDRHMQSQHGGNEQNATADTGENQNGSFEEPSSEGANATANSNAISPMNSLYVNALFGKAAPLMPMAAAHNNNNSILDYNAAFAAHLNKGLFPTAAVAAAAAAGKFYSPLQVETNAMKHPSFMYNLSQRYFDTNRTLMDMYAQHQQDKAVVAAAAAATSGNYFISPTNHNKSLPAQQETAVEQNHSPMPASPGFSCDICERNDFRTEAEVHSHRKIVHNMKTGVSLRCAYCSGNFKSRSELEHHMKTCHNSTGKHKCLICDEIFPSPAILAEHKLQHSKVGQSGKCSHCAKPLGDVAAFKAHLSEHNNESQIPVQCICCRQSLHSDFEIGLHAKFHTKSANNVPESVCALCLIEPIPRSSKEAKVCEKCCRKHNLSTKYAKPNQQQPQLQQHQRHHQQERDANFISAGEPLRPPRFVENRCNLCQMILPHAQKLQEHLVEHTFAGCEERGFNCYICSAVFTAPAGLLTHMTEHGLNARPYDCNLCSEKYYFRAELDHHLVDHELRDLDESSGREKPTEPDAEKQARNYIRPVTMGVKQEISDADNKSAAGEDDEYIEVEKVAEALSQQTAPAVDVVVQLEKKPQIKEPSGTA